MNIYDELKYLKEFVYCVKGKYFIIGQGVFLDCPSNIKNIYDDFIEKVEKLLSEIEKDFPQKQVYKDCIKSFKALTQAILEITYNKYDDNYKEKLYSFDSNLAIEEKTEIKRKKDLYIFFLGLAYKDCLNFDISINDLYGLKELK